MSIGVAHLSRMAVSTIREAHVLPYYDDLLPSSTVKNAKNGKFAGKLGALEKWASRFGIGIVRAWKFVCGKKKLV